MKKRWFLVSIILIGVFLSISLYLYSSARQQIVLPKAEDFTGKEASAFFPKEDQQGKINKKTESLNLTGPVWVEQ
jgi:hypothetical protein